MILAKFNGDTESSEIIKKMVYEFYNEDLKGGGN
jgi:hypothetical protein